MIKYFVLSLLLLVYLNLFSQKKEKEDLLFSDNSEWSEGSIMLTSGAELTGLLKYNSSNGILSYQDGNESRVFTPIKVAGFEFFDESVQKQRIFYTFKYEDSETNVLRPLFFEVIKEYKTFAILSKFDRLDMGQEANSTWYNNSPYRENTILVISQTETIYLMDALGNIKPYFKITNSEDGRKSLVSGNDVKTKNKMIDRDLLEQFIAPSEYQQIRKYTEENKLNFKIKDDFIKVLKFYDWILAK